MMMIGRIAVLLLLIMLAGCTRLNTLFPMLQTQLVTGDPVRGETIFRVGVDDAPPCSACHRVSKEGTGFSLAPNLSGIATRAADRIAGLTAEAYIEDSILHPRHYVVPGYHVSMFTEYATHLSPQDVADLVAYLMTL